MPSTLTDAAGMVNVPFSKGANVKVKVVDEDERLTLRPPDITVDETVLTDIAGPASTSNPVIGGFEKS
ncbi:protein BatD [Prevotella sp. MGM2]|nr:protein BatD [Prevotella sp. MGM2]